jgi:hypothetical protein
MTDTPPVAPVEGHYALLRNGESRGPIICDRNVRTGNDFFICPADNVSWNPIGDSDCGNAFDIIATISPADMQAVANGELERAAKDAEIAMLKTRIQDIKECWDWWQEDTYDRCSSVVDDAIRQAIKETSDE